jgi:hypothetical protein
LIEAFFGQFNVTKFLSFTKDQSDLRKVKKYCPKYFEIIFFRQQISALCSEAFLYWTRFTTWAK